MSIRKGIYYTTMEKTAIILKNGNCQAVRMPKKFNTPEIQFSIRTKGSSILLSPKTSSWENVKQSLAEYSDDFMKDGRNQPPIGKKDLF